MGAVNFSIDPKLVETLRSVLPLEVFVETGTFQGEAIKLVKPYFKHIYSIELSYEYYEKARLLFQNDPAVEILKGDSSLVLADIMPRIANQSILFWLDAHLCLTDNISEEFFPCPLIHELHAIANLNENSAIIIDDARLFLSPPPPPQKISSEWPTINNILGALKNLSTEHLFLIVNDCIIFYPKKIEPAVREYAYENGIDWLNIIDKSRDYNKLLLELKEKEREIASLKASADEKDREIVSLKAFAEEKDREIVSLKASADEKDREIVSLKEICDERERIVIMLEKRLEILRPLEMLKKWINSFLVEKKEMIKGLLSPCIGNLTGHAPRPMYVPEHYGQEKKIKLPPVISIVTPSFNHADYLERTIKSIINQEYPKLEYIIQDGGSEDGSVDILKKYSHFLKHWHSEKDEGQTQALNLGFRNTTGEIMAWLNSDDILLPGAVHYVARFFAKHPDVDVVYSHRVMIDVNDQEIGRWILPRHDNEVLSWADFVPQETLFWRRRTWDKTGGALDESFHFAMDWDMLLRFRDAGAKIVRLPRFVGGFRVHPRQKTLAVMDETGKKEMGILRERCHGRPVPEEEVFLHIKRYMLKHIVHQKLYRLGILRY